MGGAWRTAELIELRWEGRGHYSNKAINQFEKVTPLFELVTSNPP